MDRHGDVQVGERRLKVKIYETHHNRLGGHIELFVFMDEVEAADIDTPVDFAVTQEQVRSISG